MSSGVPLNSCRTVSFTAAEVFDDNGIINTPFATSASPVTKVPADMDGAAMSGSTGRFTKLPRTVAITRASHASSYTTTPIVITGTRDGKTVTESLTPANANGGDVVRGTQIFEAITSIAFPAQADTAGQFTVGCQDIGRNCAVDEFSAVELLASGTINAQFGEGSGSPTDAKPAAANQVVPMAPTRVLTSTALAAPTTVGLTVYLP